LKKFNSTVKPKKRLGQHFLESSEIAKKIVDCLDCNDINTIIEIGPGMGILTNHIIKLSKNSFFIEIDNESVEYLKKEFSVIEHSIIQEDFLKIDLKKFKSPLAIIGNFPYNISSQIVFKIIENKNTVETLVGMFQL